MSYLVSTIGFAAGIAIGFSFSLFRDGGADEARSEAQSESLRGGRKGGKSRRVTDYLSESMIRASNVPRDYIDGSKTVQDWVDLITSDSDELRSVHLLITLIPEDQIGEVVKALDEFDIRNGFKKRGSVDLACDRVPWIMEWYKVAPDEVIAWAEAGKDSEDYRRYGQAVYAIFYEDPGLATKMFNSIDISSVKGSRKLLGKLSYDVGGHIVSKGTPEEFWAYFDRQPMIGLNWLGNVFSNIQAGQHAKYLEEYAKRLGKLQAESRLLDDSLLHSWMLRDPAGLVDWSDKNFSSLGVEARTKLFRLLSKTKDEKFVSGVRNLIANDPEVKKRFIKSLSHEVTYTEVEDVLKKLNKFAPDVKLGASDVAGALKNAISYKPKHVPDVIALIADGDERFAVMSKYVNEQMYAKGAREISEVERAVIEAKISKGDYTEAQKQALKHSMQKLLR